METVTADENNSIIHEVIASGDVEKAEIHMDESDHRNHIAIDDTTESVTGVAPWVKTIPRQPLRAVG